MSVINGWESEKIFCPEKIRFVMNIVHEPWTPKELMSKCEVINNGAKRREMTGRSAVLLSISRHCVEEKDWRRVLRFFWLYILWTVVLSLFFSAPDNTLKYLSLYVPAVPSILQYNTSGHGTATGTSTQFCNHKEKERKQLSHLILTAIKLHSVPLERARIWEPLQSSATLLLYSNQTTHLSCKRE